MDTTASGQRFRSYLDFVRAEHEEILKVKWYESERLGHDCGMDYAIWQWSMRFRQGWLESLRTKGLYPINQCPQDVVTN